MTEGQSKAVFWIGTLSSAALFLGLTDELGNPITVNAGFTDYTDDELERVVQGAARLLFLLQCRPGSLQLVEERGDVGLVGLPEERHGRGLGWRRRLESAILAGASGAAPAAANAFRSAWIPAPPPESDPPTVKTTVAVRMVALFGRLL